MAESVLKRNPKIQKPQSRNYTPDRAMGSKDCKRGKLHEDRILVPEGVRPRRVADGQADVHPQHDPQKQLGAHQPARNPLRRRRSARRFRSGVRQRHGHKAGRLPRQRSRTQGQRGRCRCRFRLLRHSLFTPVVPDFRRTQLLGAGRSSGPASGTPYSNGNTDGRAGILFTCGAAKPRKQADTILSGPWNREYVVGVSERRLA